ncbi:MAG: transporter substrate-binding domain-containing protein [Verrucomicrobia bacterium]|nr:transporter substrate-binding domain-containing protein [Verrucomicrobiota bacterium]
MRILVRFIRCLALIATWSSVAWPLHSTAAEARLKDFSLTPVERAWLQVHPKIRVGFDPAWPPFSAAGGPNACSGIDADLLALLGREFGVTFEFVVRPSWTEAYAAAQRGELDLLVGTARTTERARDFLFTEPYFSFPVVIVTRTEEPILWSVLDLAGRKIAGVKDYATTTELIRTYPTLTFVPAESVADGLTKVSDGDADAFITNLPNASFVAKTRGLTNLKIAGVMPDRFDICYAVRRDWPELPALLNRALAHLDESNRQALVHPWIRVDYAQVIRWDLVWKVALATLLVGGAVLGAVIYHNRRLARELKERIRLQREIEDAHNQLVRLNEEKSELLQVAAHDLRGPLTSMQLVVDASTRLQAVPGPEALRMVEQQVKQMSAILNDVLDVEALESGRRDFTMERIEAAELARSSVARLSPIAANKQIRLEFTCDETLPPVKADRTALNQIGDNLLSNAIKFSPRGSTVRVVLRPWNGFVRLEVHDQGPGVPVSETERIFAKYVRGSARPTGGEKSTGLGLSIVRQLASAMNGRVWCEPPSAVAGSVFVFVIPESR